MSLGVRVSTGNRWDKQLANHLFVVISVDEFVKAMVAAVEAGGQQWSLLCRKKSHGGTCLLPGRICVGDRSTRRQWLAVPSPMVARLKTATGCGGCSIGDCGRVEGARRQRATTMEEEEDGSVGPSKDGADMATVEKGDGSVGAPQADGNGDIRGGRWRRWGSTSRGRRRLQRREKARLYERGLYAVEGCAVVAITVAAILLVLPTKVDSGCGKTLAVGLCEVAAQSRMRSCSRDWLWNRNGNTEDRCSDTR
ncbi:hypothetical protein GW17_00059626 [Ensete ventricosum]|nr:hypothetical protein GW17_00059626 [Ensete ventricosum]